MTFAATFPTPSVFVEWCNNNLFKQDVPIAVTVTTPHLLHQGQQLAEQLQLPFISSTPDASSPYLFLLRLTEQHLELYPTHQHFNPVYVDFIGGALRHRQRYGGGKNQSIAKAVGLRGSYKPSILDLTTGLGQDAFVLASLGCPVTMVERSPIITALLEDALQRARQTEPTHWFHGLSLQLIHRDAHHYLQALTKSQETLPPAVIYLDPMFPHKTKTALAKKEMRILRQLIGNDEDAHTLLPAALSYASKRVVVKRPKQAPYLNGQKPDLIHSGKSNRFDIYFTGNF